MCLNTRIIRNRHYSPTLKNKGIVPIAIDERLKGVEIPCGWCSECARSKRKEWRQRLKEEAISSEYGYGYFATLSISEEKMDELVKIAGTEEANEIARIAVRRFTERWRKKYRRTIRHWAVTELGGNSTERLHLHAVLWVSKEEAREVGRIWGYGNVWIERSRGEATGAYVVKYLCKVDAKHKGFRGRMFTSKNIGAGYLISERARKNRYRGSKTYLKYEDGRNKKEALANYYKRKMYSDEEREVLRLVRMDEGKRFWGGVEIEGSLEDPKILERVKSILRVRRREDAIAGYEKTKRRKYTCRGGRIIVETHKFNAWDKNNHNIFL